MTAILGGEGVLGRRQGEADSIFQGTGNGLLLEADAGFTTMSTL